MVELDTTFYYYSADVFIGYYDSDKIGINILHIEDKCCDKWAGRGHLTKQCDGKRYEASCAMSYAVSYDKIRIEMFERGMLGNILVGKTTEEEITTVLSHLGKPKAKQKVKVNKCQRPRPKDTDF